MRSFTTTAAVLALLAGAAIRAEAQTPSTTTPSSTTPSFSGATTSAAPPPAAPVAPAATAAPVPPPTTAPAVASVPLPREKPALPPAAGVVMEPAPTMPNPALTGQEPRATAAIARAAVPVGNLTAKQVETLERVSAYFNAIQTLSGDFVQVAPDGTRSQGKFFISKPGRVRFQYASPSRVEVIADGSSVAVRDRKLATQDIWPLSQTPLRFLLQEKIDLVRDANVVAVYNEADIVSVVLLEKSALAGPSKLMLMFGGNDYQLRQWTVTDPQGADTSVAVYNLDPATPPDPKLFTINYQTIRSHD